MFAVCGFWPFFARLFAVSRFLGPSFLRFCGFGKTAAVCGFWPYLHAVLRFQVILFAVLRYHQCILFCYFIDLTYIHLWLCTGVSLLMNNVFHAPLMPLMTYAQEPGTHSHNKWRVEVIITNVVLCSILIMWCLSLHPLIIAKLKDFRLLRFCGLDPIFLRFRGFWPIFLRFCGFAVSATPITPP